MRFARLTLWLLVAALFFLAPGRAAAQGAVHVVQPGENLYRIGLRYGVSWQDLMAHNGLASTRIYVGQQLSIPGVPAVLPELEGAPIPEAANGRVHVVQPGETLFLIGLRYNLTWHVLMSANGLVSTRIYVGQRLAIPSAPSAAAGEPMPVPVASDASGETYRVIPGDTLWKIAARFGLSIGELAAANGLSMESWVYTGQVLVIPGGGAEGVTLSLSGRPQSLPLDCESRSAVDWAAYFGVGISELDFFARLPISDDPDAGFVGDVYGAWGQVPPAPYGVHAEPVAAVLNGYGVAARAVRGLTWESLQAEIDAGRPVIVWVVGHVEGGAPVSYTASSGHVTLAARYEHTVIVTGYSGDRVIVLDGAAVYSRTLSQFVESWAVLGNMAIVAGT